VSATTQMPVDPRGARQFRFVGAEYVEGEARLSYALDELLLVERIGFPGAPAVPEGREIAFERALAMLHWLAGTSYYKAAAVSHVRVDGMLPTPAEAELVDAVYVHGLAEFAYVNQLDLAARFRMPREPSRM
jgi:UDP-N-acetyl-alpha-D-muramoyl-L-alanyl-L-glutamate epimerase